MWKRAGFFSRIWIPAIRRHFRGLDCFSAPEAYTFAFKGYVECNWLQLLEVGIDPAHASFLHRFEEDDAAEEGYGQQFGDDVVDSGLAMTRVMRQAFRPEIRVDETDYGLRLVTLRDPRQSGDARSGHEPPVSQCHYDTPEQ